MSEQDEQEQPTALADRLAALRGDDAADATPPEPPAAEPQADEPQPRPVEGYDPHRQAWLKTFSLGTAADLHSLNLEDAAAHEVAAALPDAAAHAARDAGYRPAGGGQLIDVRRNGTKTDLTYAVPAAERG